MYNCINEARNYIHKKKLTKLSYDGEKLTYIGTPDDKQIELLITQYYYGIVAKKELYTQLVSMGIMEDVENHFKLN